MICERMISVTILTKNSERYLERVLKALKCFDEVVVYDNGSADRTLEIAKAFDNVAVYCGPFKGFGPTHNIASQKAKHDWILSVDSDEIVSEQMAAQISALPLDPHCVYSFPRHNYFQGKWIKWCGWYPDQQKRLYHRKVCRFSEDQVHESIIDDKVTLISLKGPLYHYSYESTSDFLQKMQVYSTLFAEQNRGKKRSSLSKAISHGVYTFLKSYFLKRGFLGGYEGFVISVYMANTAFYKYLKLYEMNRSD